MNYLILIMLLLTVGLLLWLIGRHRRGDDQPALAALNEQNRELREILAGLRQEMQTASHHQFTQTTNLMQDINRESRASLLAVSQELAKMGETNKQIIGFSAQLQNLQDILKNPKQRGVLGEYFLEEILKNVLPPGTFQMQYRFNDGEVVDAVVMTKDRLIPVDSKFSLENYEKLLNAKEQGDRERWEKAFKQDLKNRIDETAKYIRPDEGTLEFAFMFIPSESIYYDLLVGRVGVDSRSLIEYAFVSKKVVIVSPTSFLAYLQTVLQGLKAMQIEDSAKTIMANVEKLGRHLNSYEDFMKKLGNGLQIPVNHYNNAYKEFKKVDKDVAKITQSESTVEALLLDKPQME